MKRNLTQLKGIKCIHFAEIGNSFYGGLILYDHCSSLCVVSQIVTVSHADKGLIPKSNLGLHYKGKQKLPEKNVRN